MISKAIDFLYNFLVFTRNNILIYNFPTTLISGAFYVSTMVFGFFKLKEKYSPKHLKHPYGSIMIFLYSVCIVGLINFMLENVWLTSFYIRYHYFNSEGTWLIKLYSSEPYIWIANYTRNFAYMFGCYISIDREIWKTVRANWKTYVCFTLLSLYIVVFFFLSTSYSQIDWSYALANNQSKIDVVSAFLIGLYGKPLFFLLFYTLWSKKS